VACKSYSNGLRSVLSFVGSMLNKSRVWSLQCVSFLVGLRTYQHPLLLLLMSSGSKTKEARYVSLSEARASQSHKMRAQVSPFTPHLLHNGQSHKARVSSQGIMSSEKASNNPGNQTELTNLSAKRISFSSLKQPDCLTCLNIFIVPTDAHY